MSLELDDFGGAKELANRRLEVAKENLNDAISNFDEGHYRTYGHDNVPKNGEL